MVFELGTVPVCRKLQQEMFYKAYPPSVYLTSRGNAGQKKNFLTFAYIFAYYVHNFAYNSQVVQVLCGSGTIQAAGAASVPLAPGRRGGSFPGSTGRVHGCCRGLWAWLRRCRCW